MAMAAAKAFMGTFGVVSVNAFRCENRTWEHYPIHTKDLAVDSYGRIWITDSLANQVYMCPESISGIPFSGCSIMGTGWNLPYGIAVYNAGRDDAVIVYVSEADESAPKVKQCMFDGWASGNFSCSDFGDDWASPRGLAVDAEGNVIITNVYGDRYGVWNCTPSEVCTLAGASNRWPHYPPDRVAADSQGNFYVSRGYELHDLGGSNYVKKCLPYGYCSDFGGDLVNGGGYDSAMAVAGDDTVYICDTGSQTLIRCSNDNVCENLGAFYCDGNMVIDVRGFFYIGKQDGFRRYCLPPSMKDIQI